MRPAPILVMWLVVRAVMMRRWGRGNFMVNRPWRMMPSGKHRDTRTAKECRPNQHYEDFPFSKSFHNLQFFQGCYTFCFIDMTSLKREGWIRETFFIFWWGGEEGMKFVFLNHWKWPAYCGRLFQAVVICFQIRIFVQWETSSPTYWREILKVVICFQIRIFEPLETILEPEFP